MNYLHRKNVLFLFASHRKRFSPFGTTEDDIKVITVKNGEGQELKEARFVEIMKSARERLKSARSLSKLPKPLLLDFRLKIK
jgi:hypothetical protein